MDDNQESETDDSLEDELTITTTTSKDLKDLKTLLEEAISTVMILTPRSLHSELGLQGTIEHEQIETFIISVDEDTKSTVSLRVSRGKSVVNLTDPSRTYRRAGPPRIPQVSDSPVILHLRRQSDRVVKFDSKLIVTSHSQPKDDGNVKPPHSTLSSSLRRPHLEVTSGQQRRSSKLKISDYDFSKPGQSVDSVRVKLDRMKSKMRRLKESLEKTREEFKSRQDSMGSSICAGVTSIKPNPGSPIVSNINPTITSSTYTERTVTSLTSTSGHQISIHSSSLSIPVGASTINNTEFSSDVPPLGMSRSELNFPDFTPTDSGTEDSGGSESSEEENSTKQPP